jgi:hypothetical protein
MVNGGLLLMVKFPLSSEAVAISSPVTLILAPGIGIPLLSLTVPVTDCAEIKPQQKSDIINKYTLIFYGINRLVRGKVQIKSK